MLSARPGRIVLIDGLGQLIGSNRPMTYLIAPDGKVARQFLGPVAMTELARIIDAAATAPVASAAPAPRT